MLGIISTYSRNLPDPELWVQMETEVGRFHHQNLLLLGWVERLLKHENDVEMKVLNRVVNSYVAKSHLV